MKLVLVGYSQGAQVVADVYQRDLSPSRRSRIAGVVVFGDPYFNPADTKPDVGSYDPTRYGGLGKRGLYPISSTPIFSICHLYDTARRTQRANSAPCSLGGRALPGTARFGGCSTPKLDM